MSRKSQFATTISRFNVMLQQQFQIAFEAVSLVMCIGQKSARRRMIQAFSMLAGPGCRKDGNIEEHDADAMVRFCAKIAPSHSGR